MPFETPISIRQAVQNVMDGRYLLPSIQRQFVWDTQQIEVLFDSVLLGYPIGSFLFWLVPDDQSSSWQLYRFLSNYHEMNAYPNQPARMAFGREVTTVLDGQQRLTSLVLGLAGVARRQAALWSQIKPAGLSTEAAAHRSAPPSRRDRWRQTLCAALPHREGGG